jgi:hypothetical protein
MNFFLIPFCQSINFFIHYFKEKKPDEKSHKIFDFLGHHHSSTSLEGDEDDELVKLEIIKERVEGHRTLLLINEEDRALYNEIKKWCEDNPDCSLEETIKKFGKKKIFFGDSGKSVAQKIYTLLPRYYFRSF